MDKIFVVNRSALDAKYIAASPRIWSALDALIDADIAKGLKSRYVAVDDSDVMSHLGGTPVGSPTDQKSNKAAVDIISAAFRPDYLVLVGGPDIIPHQDLINPIYLAARPNDERDPLIPSDLPYACNVPFSQDICNFIGPVRVVTRLPDLSGACDIGAVDYFVSVLDFARLATTLTLPDYLPCLGASASSLHKCTELSMYKIFGGNVSIQDVPPANSKWPLELLKSRTHFFNCHGNICNPEYLGDLAVAHESSYVMGKLTMGTIMAAECCYGAQLYVPSTAPLGQMGIANAYMGSGAYGFWGSTTASWGSEEANDNADLICQYFLKAILAGASIGDAALSARLSFTKDCAALSHLDLKTLAQFIILGDASIHCVPDMASEKEVFSKYALGELSQLALQQFARKTRRRAFVEAGSLLQMFKPRVASDRILPSAPMMSQLQTISAKMGVVNPSFISHKVERPPDPFAGLKAFAGGDGDFREISAFHLIFEGGEKDNLAALRVIEIAEAEGNIVFIKELFAR